MAMEMIDNLIMSLFDNAEMALDMMASGTPTPIFLGKGTMSCVDGTQLCDLYFRATACWCQSQ